jgi:hypothetical protein
MHAPLNRKAKVVSIGLLLAFLLLTASNSTSSNNALPENEVQKGERFVGAYYYVWYEEGWHVNEDTPLLGYYSSDNESVIRQQLEWAKYAGIDFLMISWSNSPEWYNGETAIVADEVFRVDDEMGCPVKLAIMIEYWHGEFDINLTEASDYIYSEYASKLPCYFKLYGKPLLFVYTLDDYSQPKWNDTRFTVRYVPLQVPYGRDTFIETALQNSETYEFTGVGPQKDNLHIDRNRDDGYYYSDIWEKVIQFSNLAANKTLVVMIATFNEWWEGTYIEPSLNYGFQYLNLTRKFVTEFK